MFERINGAPVTFFPLSVIKATQKESLDIWLNIHYKNKPKMQLTKWPAEVPISQMTQH